MFGNILYVSGSIAVPIASVIYGFILWKATPPPNSPFGYRTKRSTQSAEMWSFAQKTSGRLLVTVYAMFFPLSLAAGIIAANNLGSDGKFWTLILLVAVQTFIMALINLQTERRLKSAFNENGEPKGR